jgi:heme exporter protein C
MKFTWWKVSCIILLMYAIFAGFFVPVPEIGNLYHTARNLYFHVPMWFAMTFILATSVVCSVIYLNKLNPLYDFWASAAAEVGMIFGLLGLSTGMMWATYTWGAPWSSDPKQNTAAVALLIYGAYFVLRGALENQEQKARISAIYNIFAFAMLIPLLFIIPRLDKDSLHPGSEGNPAFNKYDLDNKMRMVFYPAILGFILLSYWLTSLRVRMRKLQQQLQEVVSSKNIIFSSNKSQ